MFILSLCRSGSWRTYPEFCKTVATATTFSTETTMNRAFHRVVAAPLFMWWKGLLPPLFFTPKHPEEGEETGGGGAHVRKRRRARPHRIRTPDGQNGTCWRTRHRLQPYRNPVAARQKYGFIQTEPKLHPDETKVSAGRNRLKLLVRVRGTSGLQFIPSHMKNNFLPSISVIPYLIVLYLYH